MKGFFLFATAFRPALRTPPPQPIKWVRGALPAEVKQSLLEAGHSPPSSAEVKNAWSYTSTPPVSLRSVVLSSEEEQLYITFTFVIWCPVRLVGREATCGRKRGFYLTRQENNEKHLASRQAFEPETSRVQGRNANRHFKELSCSQ
jgi:hypothetical protein